MIIPILNTKGTFVLEEPFNTLVKTAQIFTVTSIRSIQELEASNEEPYLTIYQAVGLTEADYKDDILKNIPIIVFATEGGEYFYVPADRLLSEPVSNGYAYRQMGLSIDLGYIPIEMNLDLIRDIIIEDVYNITSITPRVDAYPMSSITSVSKTKDTEFKLLVASKKTVDKSYKTRYYELMALYNKQKVLLGKVEEYVKTNKCKG